MTNIQIESFLSQKDQTNKPVTIFFKNRNAIVGLFIETPDYNELKAKNLWRVVGEAKIKDYKENKDIFLTRIFNGSEITKLTIKKSAQS
jgi:hypothetical protein